MATALSHRHVATFASCDNIISHTNFRRRPIAEYNIGRCQLCCVSCAEWLRIVGAHTGLITIYT